MVCCACHRSCYIATFLGYYYMRNRRCNIVLMWLCGAEKIFEVPHVRKERQRGQKEEVAKGRK